MSDYFAGATFLDFAGDAFFTGVDRLAVRFATGFFTVAFLATGFRAADFFAAGFFVADAGFLVWLAPARLAA
ncbi:MAG: hypothetical protein ABJ082_05030, partial [Parasphingorhabdus sp.]